MAICNKTGTIAIYNSMRDLFISPMADGPIKFTGNLLSEMNIDKITRFGRSFSIVRVPYSFKLLMQELMTMNVSMRIITEDNIDQLDSMSYSKTINKLTFNDTPQTTEVISSVIEFNKEKSSVGYIVSKQERRSELERAQDNTNAILLDNQKAQEKILKDIENLGWKLESRELIEGKEGEQRRYRYVFASLILDNRGSPTEIWDGVSGGYGQFPNTHPVGWSDKDLVYMNGERIPDEIMSNELARNQTPNNWLSSYMNVVSEHQKVLYKKKLLEEAKQRGEQGMGMGMGMPAESIQLQAMQAMQAQDAASPPGYPLSPEYSSILSPEYTSNLSPGYSSIFSPIPGTSPMMGAQVAQVQQQQPLSFGQAVMSLQGQPKVVIPNPLVPVMVAPAAPAQGQGILSVEKKPEDKENEGDKSPKKTVMVNLGQ
jgi:hypothetical protein